MEVMSLPWLLVEEWVRVGCEEAIAWANHIVVSPFVEVEAVGSIETVTACEADHCGAEGVAARVSSSLDSGREGVAIQGGTCDVGRVVRWEVVHKDAGPHGRFGVGVREPGRGGEDLHG